MRLCVDLDGTLCETEGTSYGDATPKVDRIECINRYYDEGHIIIVETARGSLTGENHFKLTHDQLTSWGLKFHELRTGTKIAADIYVDDKGIKDSDFFVNIDNVG